MHLSLARQCDGLSLANPDGLHRGSVGGPIDRGRCRWIKTPHPLNQHRFVFLQIVARLFDHDVSEIVGSSFIRETVERLPQFRYGGIAERVLSCDYDNIFRYIFKLGNHQSQIHCWICVGGSRGKYAEFIEPHVFIKYAFNAYKLVPHEARELQTTFWNREDCSLGIGLHLPEFACRVPEHG